MAPIVVIPRTRIASTHPIFYVVLAYIFVTYTRLPELLPLVIGHGVRLGLIMTLVAILMVLLSGGLVRTFSSRIVLALAAFTAWFCFCIPFSVWRGGSFDQLKFWLISLVPLILLSGCIDDLEQCRRAMYAMAASVLFIEAMSFVLGSSENGEEVGRFSYLMGTFANSNDFATLLLIGLPFCLLVARTRKGMSVFRVICFIGLVIIPVTVVRTGSRGGLLALVLLFVVYFFSVPPLQKIPLAVGALLLGVVALLSSTDVAMDRYKTIFHSPDTTYYSNAVEESAALSTQNRKQLFLSSLRFTAEHPILGVGPGMFQVAVAKDAEERKHPAAWHQTHNTFSQISCEEGLPALFFYLLSIYFCFSGTRAARKLALKHPEEPFLKEMAFSMRLSMIAFVITAIFASNAYYFYFPILAGLCAALERAVRIEGQRLQTAQASSGSVAPAAGMERGAPVLQRAR
jgi:O-antigen ligase